MDLFYWWAKTIIFRREQRKDYKIRKNRWRAGLDRGPAAIKNQVGEWSTMDEEKQQQTAAETTIAAPAEAGKDYSFDRDVWVTGERFTASMTPEAFAKFVKALDESK